MRRMPSCRNKKGLALRLGEETLRRFDVLPIVVSGYRQDRDRERPELVPDRVLGGLAGATEEPGQVRRVVVEAALRCASTSAGDWVAKTGFCSQRSTTSS